MSDSSLRILVVDDHAAMAHAITGILRRESHQVTMTTSGRDGVAAFELALQQGALYDVVITDFSMADLDGLGVAAAIKRRAPATIVVLLTAYALDDDNTLPPNVDWVLGKPPELAELRAALSRRSNSASSR